MKKTPKIIIEEKKPEIVILLEEPVQPMVQCFYCKVFVVFEGLTCPSCGFPKSYNMEIKDE